MHYYAFLKAVNVGGKTKLSMNELVSVVNQNSKMKTSYYLNSGNLIIDSSESSKSLEIIISNIVKEHFEQDTKVIIKDRIELENMYDKCPYKDKEASKTLIYIVDKAIKDDKAELLKNGNNIIEEHSWNNSALYIYYKNGIGRSKFTTAYIDKVLGVSATGRNLNTVKELLNR